MRNLMPDYQFLEEDKNVPIGYQHIKLHMVFDGEMHFMRKACLVSGGYMTKTPDSLTFSSVVSCKSVRTAFLLE